MLPLFVSIWAGCNNHSENERSYTKKNEQASLNESESMYKELIGPEQALKLGLKELVDRRGIGDFQSESFTVVQRKEEWIVRGPYSEEGTPLVRLSETGKFISIRTLFQLRTHTFIPEVGYFPSKVSAAKAISALLALKTGSEVELRLVGEKRWRAEVAGCVVELDKWTGLVEKSGCATEKGPLIPDAEMAIGIARAILQATYGVRELERDLYAALGNDNAWVIEGVLPPRMVGGTPYIRIRSTDGRVIQLTHSK